MPDPNAPRTPNPTSAEVRDALRAVDFPLSKEALVECAERGGWGDPVLHQLRALPLGEYGSLDEVLRSVDLAEQRGR